MEIAECTTKLAQSNLIYSMPLGRLLAEFLIQLTDIDEEIQTKFQKVILSFPADIIARYHQQNYVDNYMCYVLSFSY